MTSAAVPAHVFPPGEYLRDELEARGWTAKEFAEIIGRPVQAVSEIITGRKQIVPETALEFAEALGTSAEMWTNLQATFNLHEAKANRSKLSEVSRRARLRSLVPVSELKRRGWISPADDLDVAEREVMDLLGVEDLENEPQFAVAARRSNTNGVLSPQQMAWLAKVRVIGRSRVVSRFDLAAARELASVIVHKIHDPTDLDLLENWLGDVGIVLVTLQPLKSSKLDGAVMMLDSGNPLIGLTSRGDRMDGYIFTLLHELAHVCLNHIDSNSVRTDEDIIVSTDVRESEIEANKLASEWILPDSLSFGPERPTITTVVETASRYRVHPCLVIGRIQRDRSDWSFLRRSIPRVRPFLTGLET